MPNRFQEAPATPNYNFISYRHLTINGEGKAYDKLLDAIG